MNLDLEDIGEEEELEEMAFDTAKVVEIFNHLKTVTKDVQHGNVFNLVMDFRGVYLLKHYKVQMDFLQSFVDGAKRALNALAGTI